MPRTLTISYSEPNATIGTISFYLDSVRVCALHNGQIQTVEMSEDSHTLQARIWGVFPIMKKQIPAGSSKWELYLQNGAFSNKFILKELR